MGRLHQRSVVLVDVNVVVATTGTQKNINAVPAANVHAMVLTEELSDVVPVVVNAVLDSQNNGGQSQLLIAITAKREEHVFLLQPKSLLKMENQ